MGFSNKRFLGIHIFVLLWTITAAVAMLGSDSIAVKGGRRGTSMTGQPAPGGVEIEILMIDGAQIPQSVLRQAEQEASRIFREAGVEITWVKCGPSLEATCRVAPASNQFVVHIMPTGSGLRDTVFGMAFLGDNGRGRYCDVFFDPIAVEAPAWGTSTARLLGTVAAHELGHLILGSHAHTHLGIMTPVWGGADLRRIATGSLLFTSAQSAVMKERMGERQGNADSSFAYGRIR